MGHIFTNKPLLSGLLLNLVPVTFLQWVRKYVHKKCNTNTHMHGISRPLLPLNPFPLPLDLVSVPRPLKTNAGLVLLKLRKACPIRSVLSPHKLRM